MHLVFLNQYYPPDAAPTGVMLEGLAQGLIDAGHEVTVLCAAGGYAGGWNANAEERTSNAEHSTSNAEHSTSNGEDRTAEDCGAGRQPDASATPSATADPQSSVPRPRIIRIGATKFGRGTFSGKLVDYASYYLGAGWKLLTLRPRPDRIVALTTPPYLSVMARLLSNIRGADHAHWVMDLYPDVLAAHGMLAADRVIYRFLAGLTRWGMGGKRCAAVLTLGPDMAQRVGRHVKGAGIADGGAQVEAEGGDVKSYSLEVIRIAEEARARRASATGHRPPPADHSSFAHGLLGTVVGRGRGCHGSGVRGQGWRG